MEIESRKQISVGAVLSYLVIIVQFATGLIYTPIVLKSLGQSEYGVYSLCTSFIGYLTIMNAGANAAYIRFYVQTKIKEPHKLPTLNGIFLKIFIGLALIALIGGWSVGVFSPIIFGNKISFEEYELVKICLKLLSVNSSVQVINCVFSSLIIANEKFIFSKLINLLVAVCNPLLTIPFLLSGYSCVSIILVHLATMLMTLSINLFYCLVKIKVSFLLKGSETELFKSIVLFAGFIVLQSIMDQVNWQIDKFILARTHGTSEISLYSVGSTFNRYYITFSSALASVFIAQVNKLQANNDIVGINKLFIKSSRLFAYFIWLFISAFIVFGKEFVLRWAGNEYGKSYLIGLFLMLPVTASLTMGLAQDIARAMNKHQIQILINFAICIVNGIISIPLAIKWGALGSAIGTFAAETCMCIIVEPIYYHKALGLHIKMLIKQLIRITPGLALPIGYGILINYFNLLKANYTNIAMYGIIYLIIYFFSMRMIAFDDSEKNLFNKVLVRVLPLRKKINVYN